MSTRRIGWFGLLFLTILLFFGSHEVRGEEQWYQQMLPEPDCLAFGTAAGLHGRGFVFDPGGDALRRCNWSTPLVYGTSDGSHVPYATYLDADIFVTLKVKQFSSEYGAQQYIAYERDAIVAEHKRVPGEWDDEFSVVESPDRQVLTISYQSGDPGWGIPIDNGYRAVYTRVGVCVLGVDGGRGVHGRLE